MGLVLSAKEIGNRKSAIPMSRRFFRRVKSAILRFDPIYRLHLHWKYGTDHILNCPPVPLPNRVLQSRAEWKEASEGAARLHLPFHPSPEKNWDHIAAVHAIVSSTPKSAYVLDAGAEFYSNVLPALYVYGYRNLYGMNLSFSDPARRGTIRYFPGDITDTGFPASSFDAVTCMSVIEHGVPIEPYFREMFRILKPGGLLITSTDYWPTPIDTHDKIAHGAPIKIFSKNEISEVVASAQRCGFESTGDFDLDCPEPTVRWDPYGLEYTFIIFTLRKPN